MKNPLDHPAMTDISLFALRLTLGLYVLLAGFNKISGPGLAKFANGPFMDMKPDWLPDAAARPYGYVLPVLELFAGLLVLIGLFTRWSAGVMTLMLLSIFIAVITTKGLSGGGPVQFHDSIILTAAAFVLAVVGAGRLSLDALYFSGGASAGGGGKGK